MKIKLENVRVTSFVTSSHQAQINGGLGGINTHYCSQDPEYCDPPTEGCTLPTDCGPCSYDYTLCDCGVPR